MPQVPGISLWPKAKARIVSGLPRPAIAGNASCAPSTARLRISGIGLISFPIGMKPETIDLSVSEIGNGHAGIAGTSASGLAHAPRTEEHTSELQSRGQLVCRLLLE